MRWFIGLLVLANLAIFAWSKLYESPPQQVPLAEPGVGNIRLLREVEPVQPAQPDAGKGVAETRALVAPAAIEAVVESEQEYAPPAKLPVADTPPETHEAEPEPTRVVAETVPPACRRLGYFVDESQAQQALKQLQDQRITASLGSDTHEQISGYWVLIPASKDRDAGKAKVAELKAAGVKDVWLFAKGSLKNAISLGLFSTQANAGRRAKQVEIAGFEPDIVPKVSESPRYWLDYSTSSGWSADSLKLPKSAQLKDQAHECPSTAG